MPIIAIINKIVGIDINRTVVSISIVPDKSNTPKPNAAMATRWRQKSKVPITVAKNTVKARLYRNSQG